MDLRCCTETSASVPGWSFLIVFLLFCLAVGLDTKLLNGKMKETD
jgi:hypothetical protein